jgi:hypothetical protein
MILVDSYESNEVKTLQSSPYEVSTWAWLPGISQVDIHTGTPSTNEMEAIHALV